MAQVTVTDLYPDPPELIRARNPTTHVADTPFISPISLSDSEPEPDLDFDPIFEPFFSDPSDHSYYPHHHRDFSLLNHYVFHRSSEPEPDPGPDIGLGLGLGLGPTRYGVSDRAEVNLELGLGLANSSSLSLRGNDVDCGDDDEKRRFEGGLRVINLDSDTESDNDHDRGLSDDDDYDLNGDGSNLGFGGVSDFDRPPFCWDYLGFNNNRARGGDDNGYNCSSEMMNMSGSDEIIEIDVSDDVDTDVSIVFDTYQEREEQREITIESDDDDDEGGILDFGVDDAIRDLEWEILLAVNNFNREVYDMDFNVDMYEAILGEVEERMNEWMGSPPAAEAVIESLLSVNLVSGTGLNEDEEVVCAICKDDVLKEEVVKQLPCSHYYHGHCILPWLKLRNTCPVCRYELPTDDAEYEYQKREREGGIAGVVDEGGLSLESQVSDYDFHVYL